MAEENYPPIDDEYTTGVYYDSSVGEYCKINPTDDGEEIELINPETDEVYWTLSLEEWHEKAEPDMFQVLDRAVNQPKSLVEEALDTIGRNDPNELMKLSDKWAISLNYARKQVEMSEL